MDDHDIKIEGAWIRILCRLWWSETRGISTKSLSQWARILRESNKKTLTIIEYLQKHDIADVIFDDSICISSRRMVKDEKLRTIRKNSGSMGGNPELIEKYNIPGYVYLAERESDGAIKIGIAINPQARIYKLSNKYGEKIKQKAIYFVDNMGLREKELHLLYNNKKLQGEWFNLDKNDVVNIDISLKGKVGQNPTPSSSSSSSISSSNNYPSWLNLDLWQEFIKYRKKMRSPFTDTAEKLNLNKLILLKDQGNDPIEVINQTIERGWKAFFPIQKEKISTGNRMQDQNFEAARQFLEEDKNYGKER